MTTVTSLPAGYTLHEGYPAVPAYLHLRSTAGLSPHTSAQVSAALTGSWYGCYITHNPTNADGEDLVVAMGRIVGDGGWYFHIADMAVLPDHQRKGLGDAVLKKLLERIRLCAPSEPDVAADGKVLCASPAPYVSLLADAPGRKLYARNGFVYTSPASLGMMLPGEELYGSAME
ncbi:hypothetical protein FE257_000791 [Aspergillus nanangensis]|uniref:N-acetyltransferase domain-containing protein n=1 Tax=Aspergillus nanangensis TaxID=2582783 RepID=A0AAD4CEQ2_ASPNN|nr:hypothetical protein FE257_000791 [Aspergillus nanangensis]